MLACQALVERNGLALLVLHQTRADIGHRVVKVKDCHRANPLIAVRGSTTAHGFLDDEFGNPAGVPIADFSRLAVEVGAENQQYRPIFGPLHDCPPACS